MLTGLDGAIDAALTARSALGIRSAADIGLVTIDADPSGHADQFGSPAKKRPTQVVEAQFAQPFQAGDEVAQVLVFHNQK